MLNLKLSKMKTIQVKMFVLLLLTAFACNDDNDNSPAVANDEAADMIATSVASGSAGLTTVIDDATVTTEANGGARTSACGYAETKDLSKSSPSGASITYLYNYHYDYALSCTNALPTAMSVNLNYKGSLDAPRLFTENEGEGTLSVKTLDATYTYFTINGTYDRTGSFESKVRNQSTSTSTITITMSDVTVDKTTKAITGGSASVTIEGTVTGKGSFNYSGSIVFKGNRQSELTVNGTKYSINLETGEVTTL